MPRVPAVVSVLIILPATLWCGYCSWHFTAFFHGELIHQTQMAFGDGGIPAGERLSSYVVWIPFALFLIASVWINLRLLLRALPQGPR
ncbi:hypothetical protein JIN84_05680 [Luteolibacter yonseiensis]|uniref:Uncharacterized protein n=1 Tax=Luteolibacter yonseiensis TaxID=1144680 RepID=A0A934VAP7_9BACT|nr:hypothetical protein [Luteolibacter yonseiensis]MBK1815091.1 hypothetical protein [Luteolibacter yonseiensis]